MQESTNTNARFSWSSHFSHEEHYMSFCIALRTKNWSYARTTYQQKLNAYFDLANGTRNGPINTLTVNVEAKLSCLRCILISLFQSSNFVKYDLPSIGKAKTCFFSKSNCIIQFVNFIQSIKRTFQWNKSEHSTALAQL